MRQSNTTNDNLKELLIELKRVSSTNDAPIWKKIASDLSQPTRQRKVVNLSKISRYTKEDETVVVPGKVLSCGNINHKIKVAAFSFSKEAKDKIKAVKGDTMSIQELIKSNPKGKGLKILG
jgi:large subunit ribosomal protein L18e